MDRQFSRRTMLKSIVYGASAVVAAGCASPQAATTAQPTQTPMVVEKIVTQVVEKPVEKVVTQVVEKSVEKVVVATPVPKGEVTINFWHIWAKTKEGEGVTAGTPPDKIIRGILDNFEKESGYIKVKDAFIQFTESGSFQQKLQAAVAGGVAPDVATLSGASNYAAMGGAIALDDLIKRDSKEMSFDDFLPRQVGRQKWQGRIFGIPGWNDANFLLWWNKDHFKEAGLDPEVPPKTWDELKTFSTKLLKKDGSRVTQYGFVPTYGQGWFLAYLYLTGIENIITDDPHPKPNFANDRGYKALQFMVDLTDINGGIASQASVVQGFTAGAQNPFLTGKMSMKPDGNWSYGDIQKYKGDRPINFGVSTMPIPDGGIPATTSGGFGWSIPAGSRHIEEGWSLVKYLSSKPVLLRICQEMTLLPSRVSLFEDQYFQKDPVLKVFTEALKNARGWGEGPWGGETWDLVMIKARDQALYHQKTPQQALDEAAPKVQAAIDKYFTGDQPAG